MLKELFDLVNIQKIMGMKGMEESSEKEDR